MDNQELMNLETLDFELEFFEPMARARSNTWPLPRPEGFIETNPSIDNIAMDHDQKAIQLISHKNNNVTECSSLNKKQSTRNAHGSPTYAELITQAISSAKDQRLTLSEIYAWMIEHVPSIKDREEGTGWRNSVRHNLSLHNRFVRVPNENAGKSSWWMINPDETFGKSTRRRSTTMEAKKYQRSRSRAKKNAQLVNGETMNVKTTADQYQLHHAFYPNHVEVEQSLIFVDTNQLIQPIQNTCTVNYTFGGRLSPILAISNEAEYYHSQKADDPDSSASILKTNVETISLSISQTSLDENNYNPSNEQTLTSFNSFLDDVNDIISKHMTDC